MIRYTILLKIGGFFNLKTEFVGITGTFIKYYKISQLIHTQSIAN